MKVVAELLFDDPVARELEAVTGLLAGPKEEKMLEKLLSAICGKETIARIVG